jgi:hypothetical protein
MLSNLDRASRLIPPGVSTLWQPKEAKMPESRVAVTALPGGIVQVKPGYLGEGTGRQVRAAVETAQAGVILDLRGGRGDAGEAAEEIIELFAATGPMLILADGTINSRPGLISGSTSLRSSFPIHFSESICTYQEE